MMLFPTAIRRDFASMIFRYGPAVVALVYPLALAALHLSGQHFVRATKTTNRLLAGFAIFLAAALVSPRPPHQLHGHIAVRSAPRAFSGTSCLRCTAALHADRRCLLPCRHGGSGKLA